MVTVFVVAIIVCVVWGLDCARGPQTWREWWDSLR
jgi:hypothetical protein